MIAVLLMKIAFWGGNAFWKTVEVALQKLLGVGGGGGLHDCLRLLRLLTTNTRQLEILVTTLGTNVLTFIRIAKTRVHQLNLDPFL